MQNIIDEPTRLTPQTKILIDLIVATRPEFTNITGVLPLGISDHCLIYPYLKLHVIEIIKTPFCNKPTGTHPSVLFSLAQWKLSLPGTQRIF